MYQKHAWRFGQHKGTKECKVTFPEGGWVNLILVDDLDGKPQMVVSREKAAVKWMENTFVDICDRIPGMPTNFFMHTEYFYYWLRLLLLA